MADTDKTTKRRPPSNGVKFSKENQPTGAAKSAGMRKKRLLKDIMAMAFKGPKGGKLKKLAANYMGVPEDSLTTEDMLHFRQIERAISKSNTFAYMALMDRAFGKPKGSDDEIPKKIVVTIKK